jgi:hypothetical protein
MTVLNGHFSVTKTVQRGKQKEKSEKLREKERKSGGDVKEMK